MEWKKRKTFVASATVLSYALHSCVKQCLKEHYVCKEHLELGSGGVVHYGPKRITSIWNKEAVESIAFRCINRIIVTQHSSVIFKK